MLSMPTIQVDTLRLDLIHPIISGNKWYKLNDYLQDAIAKNSRTIASFGGPYSNHLVALAYAANSLGLKSIGYVRSNKNEPLTHSLQAAIAMGMELIYLGRTSFQAKKQKLLEENVNELNKAIYLIDEGGYGPLGVKGATSIISQFEPTQNKEKGSVNTNPLDTYHYIICAVGTGTMLAGILQAAKKSQKIIGIVVLKNEGTLQTEIQNLLVDKNTPFSLLHQFHQGGYAKTSSEQIDFMNQLWVHAKIPTDIVYTGKVFYAVAQLVQQNYFKPGSKVLVIHSGGIQGNKSLAKNVLHFTS